MSVVSPSLLAVGLSRETSGPGAFRSARTNLRVKVLDVLQGSGPKWTLGSTIGQR